MTKNTVLSAKMDITAQMDAVGRLIEFLKQLHGGADHLSEDQIRKIAEEMASEVRIVSERAYDLGEKIFERAA